MAVKVLRLVGLPLLSLNYFAETKRRRWDISILQERAPSLIYYVSIGEHARRTNRRIKGKSVGRRVLDVAGTLEISVALAGTRKEYRSMK
jgi:hypothetical protein